MFYGGAEKACMHLCNYHVQFHEVYLISLCDLDEFMYPPEQLDTRVKLITLGKHSGFNGRLLTYLYSTLRSIKPSVIHTHTIGLFYVTYYILINRKPSVIHTVHTFAEKDSPGLYHYYYSALLKLRRVQMIANSEAVSISAEKLYGSSYNKYIHLGIGRLVLSEDHSNVKKKVESYKGSNRTKIFLHIGRIAPEKNQLLLYQAFHLMIKEGYDIILLILGDIQSKSIFQQLEELSHPRIHYLGRKNNVADYLANADAFCLTSEYEGLSLATIEAMSMRVIPICTPAGGVEEVVKDGYNGFLSEDHTVEGYVKAIKRYFALNDGEREVMRDNAFLTYKKHFTIEQCGKAYMELYEEALKPNVKHRMNPA